MRDNHKINDENEIRFSQEGKKALQDRIRKYEENKSKGISIQAHEVEFRPTARCENHNELVYTRKRKKSMFLVLAAAIVLSVAMGTVGIGARNKILESSEKQVEEVQYRMLESEEELMYADDMLEEQNIKQQVDEFFGQRVVWPQGGYVEKELLETNVYEPTGTVNAIFSLNEEMFIYEIIKNSNKVSKLSVQEDKVLDSRVHILDGIEFIIKEAVKDEISTYVVHFEVNGLYYTLSTNGSDVDNVIKIIENLK